MSASASSGHRRIALAGQLLVDATRRRPRARLGGAGARRGRDARERRAPGPAAHALGPTRLARKPSAPTPAGPLGPPMRQGWPTLLEPRTWERPPVILLCSRSLSPGVLFSTTCCSRIASRSIKGPSLRNSSLIFTSNSSSERPSVTVALMSPANRTAESAACRYFATSLAIAAAWTKGASASGAVADSAYDALPIHFCNSASGTLRPCSGRI